MTLQEALKVNGKARRPNWVRSWIIFDPIFYGSCGAFLTDSGIIYEPSADDIMAEDWEPYKEPCKHEPFGISQIVARPFMELKEEDIIIPFCGKCGVKIKAEKWVEV